MDYENLTPQYRIEEYLEAIVEGWVDATVVAYPEVPSWRIEEFLDAFITYIWEDGDHPRKPCPEPVWHIEECLRAIYDVMTGAATPWPFPTPTNRIEEYLAAIHAYLADGTELPVPAPTWRIEQWLAYALDAVKQGGGIEKTVSGTMVHITDALAKAALSVLVNITPIQPGSGDPSPENVRPISGRTGLTIYVSPTPTSADATTYAVDWTNEAGTVYGGTLDVVTGVLTVDAVLEVFNVVDENTIIKSQINSFNKASGSVGTIGDYTRISFAVRSDVDQTQYNRLSNGYNYKISNMLKHYYAYNDQSAHWYRNAVLYAFFPTSLVGSTAQSVYDYLASIKDTTPLSFWLELATPLTYQLTPQEVQMLLGENYVWSSSGDTVSVTYYAEGNANPLQSLNILLGGNYSNPKTADDVSDKEALEIILGGNK